MSECCRQLLWRSAVSLNMARMRKLHGMGRTGKHEVQSHAVAELNRSSKERPSGDGGAVFVFTRCSALVPPS